MKAIAASETAQTCLAVICDVMQWWRGQSAHLWLTAAVFSMDRHILRMSRLIFVIKSAQFISGQPYLLCFTAATRSGPENMEKRLSPFAEDVSSLELAESPWFADQLLLMASLK